jgi:hypothetical protein
MEHTLLRKPLILLALICIGNQPGLSGQQQKAQSASTTREFPGFSVRVTLSDKADKLLTAQKETIIVAAYFSGSPKPGTPKKYLSEIGQIDLGEAHVEVAPGEIAKFGTIRMRQDSLSYVDKDGPQLLINVYSGRKSSKDNLLDCGIYEDAIAPIEGKTIPIACKLIGE